MSSLTSTDDWSNSSFAISMQNCSWVSFLVDGAGRVEDIGIYNSHIQDVK